MDISFEWNTTTLDHGKKEALEGEIHRKLAKHIETLTRMAIRELVVSLHEAEASDILVKGEIFRVDVPEKQKICQVVIDHGFYISCDMGSSFFQPRGRSLLE